jgi:apolipoprotein N-acyltransferase
MNVWPLRIALIVAAAAAQTLALPPWRLAPLAWIALVPLLLALRGLRPRAGFAAGLLWGILAIWGVGFWVPIALANYYQQPLWFGLLFSLGASVIFAGVYAGGFAASLCACAPRRDGMGRVLIPAMLWVAWELARARLLSGDPWLLLGYSIVPMAHVVQVADVGGVYLLSFLIVAVNAAFAELLVRRSAASWSGVVLAASLVLAAFLYGTARLAVPLPTAPALPIAVVQGNNNLGTQWRAEYYGAGLADYLRMSERAAASHPRLLVWPESAVTFFLAHEPSYRAAIAQTLRRLHAELIVGAPHYEGDPDVAVRYFNSAFHIDADGALGDRYDKQHLLPFAEYFPLRTIEFLRRRFERVRFFTQGPDTTLLRTGFGDVAVVICFEGIFPELVRGEMARGAALLVNLSNDTWLGGGAGPEQHLAMVALRAIENRTWIVRATTSGISAIVDPFGRVTARTPTFTSDVLAGTVVPMTVPTLYKRVGDAFAYVCLLSSLALLVTSAAAARRAGTSCAESSTTVGTSTGVRRSSAGR